MAAKADPISALFGGPVQAGGGGPSTATGWNSGALDSSGWNVNFGGGSIDSARSDAGDMGQYLPYALAFMGVLVVWRLTRKR